MKIHLIQIKINELLAVCDEHNNDPGELINILHAAQGIFGYLPREVQEIIAGRLHIPVSRVYGVVTFYSFFTMTPKGKYPISVCLGTACYVRGAEKVLDEFQRQLEIKVGETTPDGLFSLDCLRCVGACGLAPVVTIAGKVYGRLTPELFVFCANAVTQPCHCIGTIVSKRWHVHAIIQAIFFIPWSLYKQHVSVNIPQDHVSHLHRRFRIYAILHGNLA